jgi:hypothetical protein
LHPEQYFIFPTGFSTPQTAHTQVFKPFPTCCLLLLSLLLGVFLLLPAAAAEVAAPAPLLLLAPPLLLPASALVRACASAKAAAAIGDWVRTLVMSLTLAITSPKGETVAESASASPLQQQQQRDHKKDVYCKLDYE